MHDHSDPHDPLLPGPDSVWTSQEQAYMTWLATAPEERQPATKQAMAAQLGISTLKLLRLEQRPGFAEGMRQFRAQKETPNTSDAPHDVLVGAPIQPEGPVEWAEEFVPQPNASWSID